MNFLVDNAISPWVSSYLNSIGHESIHVRDVGLKDAADEVIFQYAFEHNLTIISADTDFAFLLSKWNRNKPSLILFRKGIERDPVLQAEVLFQNLTESVIKYIEKGAILILEKDRIRIRNLPLI